MSRETVRQTAFGSDHELARFGEVDTDDSIESGPTSGPRSGPPAIIDGRYAVEDVLGEGTAGVVYLCRHLVIGRLVAIKVLRYDFVQDEQVRERFANEARAASAIGNEHIVETLDFGTMPDGSTYIVMELLEGMTLREVCDERGLLPFSRILKIMLEVVQGLGAVHKVGIVHRDVKPDNLFIVDPGNTDFVKVLDFGVAKMASSQASLTRAGTVFGTPHYMSPEQAEGQSADERADIYSVGVTLYELATGSVPFDAEAPLGILTQHMTEPPPPMSQRLLPERRLPDGYEAIVLKCMAKRPVDRYQTMQELGHDLAQLADGASPKAANGLFVRRSFERFRSGARAVGVLGAVAGLGGGAVGWFTLDLLREPPPVQVVTKSVLVEAPPAPTLESVAPVAEETETRRVDLVLFPLDAHVFLDDEDLGRMPVSVEVPPGETRTVFVKHPGYIARRVVLDGTESRVVVGLRHWKESRWAKKAQQEQDSKAVREREPSPPPVAPQREPVERTTVAPASLHPTQRSAAPARPPEAVPKEKTKTTSP